MNGGNNGRIEFADNDGGFNLNDFPDRSNFKLVVNFEDADQQPSSSNAGPSTNTPQQQRSSTPTPQALHNIRRRVLATIKVVLADIGTNGKPCNWHFHQTAAHINLYTEEQATVGFITSKVRDEMIDQTLVIVGPNGLRFYDQDGTRGDCYYFLEISAQFKS